LYRFYLTKFYIGAQGYAKIFHSHRCRHDNFDICSQTESYIAVTNYVTMLRIFLSAAYSVHGKYRYFLPTGEPPENLTPT